MYSAAVPPCRRKSRGQWEEIKRAEKGPGSLTGWEKLEKQAFSRAGAPGN